MRKLATKIVDAVNETSSDYDAVEKTEEILQKEIIEKWKVSGLLNNATKQLSDKDLIKLLGINN